MSIICLRKFNSKNSFLRLILIEPLKKRPHEYRQVAEVELRPGFEIVECVKRENKLNFWAREIRRAPSFPFETLAGILYSRAQNTHMFTFFFFRKGSLSNNSYRTFTLMIGKVTLQLFNKTMAKNLETATRMGSSTT